MQVTLKCDPWMFTSCHFHVRVLRIEDRIEVDVAVTRVWFRPVDAAECEEYVATGEPLDKAGAYGIQGFGCGLVDRIEGCYFNVMGLPVARLLGELPPNLRKGG